MPDPEAGVPVESELGSPVIASVVVARAPTFVLAIVEARTFSIGTTVDWRLIISPGVEQTAPALAANHGPQGLRVAVQRGVWSLPSIPLGSHLTSPILLRSRGPGGGGAFADVHWWMSPSPPVGPWAITVEWLDIGYPSSTVVLDVADVSQAAAQSERSLPRPWAS